MGFCLAKSVKVHFRPAVPVFFAVPQFHALDSPPIAIQIQRACAAPIWDPFPKNQFLRRAIPKVNEHSLKIDRSAAHAQLYGAPLPVSLSNVNIIVVIVAIDVSISKVPPPFALGVNRHGKSQAYQQAEQPYVFSLDHSSLRVFKVSPSNCICGDLQI